MRQKLDSSLKRDEKLFKIIKKRLKRTNEFSFNFKVNISKQKYLKMVKKLCLDGLPGQGGAGETIKTQFKHHLNTI